MPFIVRNRDIGGPVSPRCCCRFWGIRRRPRTKTGDAMQMQPTTSSPCCPLSQGPHQGFAVQQRGIQCKMSEAGHTQQTLALAASKSDHTFVVHAAQSVYPRQHRKSLNFLHSVSPLQGAPYAGRASTQLAAGNFMGLMGQILKDMSQAVPSGSSLTVDNLSYHPAGKPPLSV